MKHLFAGYDSFSALYRAEIFHGDLSENETMLDKVSEYIKTHDKGAETVDELVRELSGVNITMAIVIKCIDHHNPSFRSSQTSLLFTDFKLF